jgi:hypothetical protein
MSMPYMPFAVPMTLLKRAVSGQDEYGNDTYTETPVTIQQCVFQPAGSTENLIFADQVSTTDTIFMPGGTDVSALDAIQYNGDTYEVTGAISAWTSPFSGRISPIRINVLLVSGGSPS